MDKLILLINLFRTECPFPTSHLISVNSKHEKMHHNSVQHTQTSAMSSCCKRCSYITYRQKGLGYMNKTMSDWKIYIYIYIYELFHVLLLSSSTQKPYSKLPYPRGNDSTVHTSADVRRYKPRFDLIRTRTLKRREIFHTIARHESKQHCGSIL